MGVLRCLRQLGVLPDAPTALDTNENKPGAYPGGHTVATEYLNACGVWSPLLLAAAGKLPVAAKELLHNGTDPAVGQVHQGSILAALLSAENLPHAFSWSLGVCPETAKRPKRAMQCNAMQWPTQSTWPFPPRFRRGVWHVFGLKLHS